MASYVGGSPVLEDENGNKVISFPTVTRTGYTFNKWLDTQGLELSVSSIKNDKTFYADWMANSYVVTFDPNGGSVTTTGKNVTYDSAYGELPEPMLVGYSFAGWYTAPTGGTKVTNTTTVATASDHTLYAHWTANQYTVTFDSNGGSCSENSRLVNSGSVLGTLPTPTKSGTSGQILHRDTDNVSAYPDEHIYFTDHYDTITYGFQFLGWFTAASGGTLVTDESTMGGEDITLYAHYKTISHRYCKFSLYD